jgi:hypothetical protein
MSLRPDFLSAILDAARLHFSDGALTRAQHEMIASYVSAFFAGRVELRLFRLTDSARSDTPTPT